MAAAPAAWDALDVAQLRQLLQEKRGRVAAIEGEVAHAATRRAATLNDCAAARTAARADAVKAASALREAQAKLAAQQARAAQAKVHADPNADGRDIVAAGVADMAVDADAVAADYAAMEDLDTGDADTLAARQARLFADAIDYPHRGYVYEADPDGGPPQRLPSTAIVPCTSQDKGRVLRAGRGHAAGEVLFYDTSVLDVPNTVASCLIAKKFGVEVEKFMKIARAGKAVTPHDLKTKVLEDGIVLLSRVKKEGKDLEQGFDMNPVNVSGCQFRDGIIPVLVEFLENCQDPERREAAQKVFDLACPIADADEATAARYVALTTAFLNFIAKPLPEYKRLLTTDKAVHLLLTVQCNGVAYRRQGHAGIAVFPFASLMEHSCYPNATAHILHKTGDRNESIVKVTALRPIAQGESISIAYSSTYHTAADRGAMLRTSHFFTCGCDWCKGVDRARGMLPDGLPDPRYAPPGETTTIPQLAEELLKTLRGMRENAIPPPKVVMPVGARAEEWRTLDGAGRRLTSSNAADNLVIRRYTAGEKAAPHTWQDCQARIVQGDWGGLVDWMQGEDTLHPSHHLVAAVLVQCTHAAFRLDNTRMTLWLLRCLLLNAYWVEGNCEHAHVAPAMAEYADVAARVCVKIEQKALAQDFVKIGIEALEANGLDGTLRHRQLQGTVMALGL